MSVIAEHIHLIDEVFLSWRPGPGHSRYIIGRFYRHDERVDFEYLLNSDMAHALDEGFLGYADLPLKPDKLGYTDVLPVISRRLIDKDRSDRIHYLQFWNADEQHYDDFDIIGLTQAWLTNDRLEFLASFEPKDGLTFVTDLSGQSALQVDKLCVMNAEPLSYEIEQKEEFEYPVVTIFNCSHEILGRIKKVHNRLFSHSEIGKYQINLSLKDSEQNGILRKVFIKVNLSAKAL